MVRVVLMCGCVFYMYTDVWVVGMFVGDLTLFAAVGGCRGEEDGCFALGEVLR